MADSTNTVGSRSDDQSMAQQAVEQTQEKVQQVAEKARDASQQATEQARGTLKTQVDQRSSQVAGQIASTADNLRTVGEELRRQGNDTAARVADQVAGRAQGLSDYLGDSDADRILRDLEDFARRQPWAVVAGGLALGFVASRFIKASSAKRYDTQFGSSTGGSFGASSSTTDLASAGTGTSAYGLTSELPESTTSASNYTEPTYGSPTV